MEKGLATHKSICRVSIIEPQPTYATGWFFTSNGYILTVGHIFVPDDNHSEILDVGFDGEITIETEDNMQFRAQLIVGQISSTLNYDFAILKIEETTTPFCFLPLNLTSIVRNHENLKVCGYSNRSKYNFSCKFEGYVASDNGNLKMAIYSENTGIDGFSGSPIYDEKSLSVLSMQYATTKELNIVYCISVKKIFQQIRSHWLDVFDLLERSIRLSVDLKEKNRPEYRFGIPFIEFCERPEEWAYFMDFLCNQRNGIYWFSVSGDAGTGKSSLLYNLVHNLKIRLDWDIKEYRNISLHDRESFVNVEANTIFIIDGINHYDVVGEFICELLDSNTQYEIRIIVSDRRSNDVVKNLLTYGVRRKNYKYSNLVELSFAGNLNLNESKLNDDFFKTLLKKVIRDDEYSNLVNIFYLLTEIKKVDPFRNKPLIAVLFALSFINSSKKRFDSNPRPLVEILYSHVNEQRGYIENLVDRLTVDSNTLLSADIYRIIVLSFGTVISIDEVQNLFHDEWNNILRCFGSFNNAKNSLNNMGLIDDDGKFMLIQPSIFAESAFLLELISKSFIGNDTLEKLWGLRPIEFAGAISKLFSTPIYNESLASIESSTLRSILIPRDITIFIVDSSEYTALISNAVAYDNTAIASRVHSLLDIAIDEFRGTEVEVSLTEAYAIGLFKIDRNRVDEGIIDRIYKMATFHIESETINYVFLRFVIKHYSKLATHLEVINLFEQTIMRVSKEDYYGIMSAYLAKKAAFETTAYDEDIAFKKLNEMVVEVGDEDSLYNFGTLLLDTIQYDDESKLNNKLQIFDDIRNNLMNKNMSTGPIDECYASTTFIYPFIVFDENVKLKISAFETFKKSQTSDKGLPIISLQVSNHMRSIIEGFFSDFMQSIEIEAGEITDENYWDIWGDSFKNSLEVQRGNLDVFSLLLKEINNLKHLIPHCENVSLYIPDSARLLHSVEILEKMINNDNYSFVAMPYVMLNFYSVMTLTDEASKKQAIGRINDFCDMYQAKNSKMIFNIFAVSLKIYAESGFEVDTKYIDQLERLLIKYGNDNVLSFCLLHIFSSQLKHSNEQKKLLDKMMQIIDNSTDANNLIFYYLAILNYFLSVDKKTPTHQELEIQAEKSGSIFYEKYKELLEKKEVSAKGVFGVLFSKISESSFENMGRFGDVLLEIQRFNAFEIALTVIRNALSLKPIIKDNLSWLLDKFFEFIPKSNGEPLYNLYCLDLLFHNLMLASSEDEIIALLRKFKLILGHVKNDQMFFVQSYVNYLFVLHPCDNELENQFIYNEISSYASKYKSNAIIIELFLGMDFIVMSFDDNFSRITDDSFWEQTMKHLSQFSYKKDIVFIICNMLLSYVTEETDEVNLNIALDRYDEIIRMCVDISEEESNAKELIGELSYELGSRLLLDSQNTHRIESLLTQGLKYGNKSCNVLLSLMIRRKQIKNTSLSISDSLPDDLILSSDLARLVQSLYLALQTNDWLLSDLLISSLELDDDECLELLQYFLVDEFESNLLMLWFHRHGFIDVDFEFFFELKKSILSKNDNIPDWMFTSSLDAPLVIERNGTLIVKQIDVNSSIPSLIAAKNIENKKLKEYVLNGFFNKPTASLSLISNTKGMFSVRDTIEKFDQNIKKGKYNSVKDEIENLIDGRILTPEQCIQLSTYLKCNDMPKLAFQILNTYYEIYPLEREILFDLIDIYCTFNDMFLDNDAIISINKDVELIVNEHALKGFDESVVNWIDIQRLLLWMLKRQQFSIALRYYDIINGTGNSFLPDSILSWGRLVTLLAEGKREDFIANFMQITSNFDDKIKIITHALNNMASNSIFTSVNRNNFTINELLAIFNISSKNLFNLGKIMLSSGICRDSSREIYISQQQTYKAVIPLLMQSISINDNTDVKKYELLGFFHSQIKRNDISRLIDDSHNHDFLYRSFKKAYTDEFHFGFMENILRLNNLIHAGDVEHLEILIKRFASELEVSNG